MKRTIIKALKTFHVWGGLTAGAIFCVLSLSGSVLVLRPLLEAALRPAWAAKSTARPAHPISEATRQIAAQWPGSSLYELLPAQSLAGEKLEFGIQTPAGEKLRVFADAKSGEVLGTFQVSWMTWMVDLHHHLLIESFGKKLVGFIGLFLFLISLTGVVMWAVRAAPWQRLLGSRRAGRRVCTAYDWHRTMGVIGNFALLFISLTGAITAFPQTTARLLGVPGEPAKAASKEKPKKEKDKTKVPSAGIALEDYMSAASHALPGGVIKEVRMQAGRNPTIRVWKPGDLSEKGDTRVTMRASAPEVAKIDVPGDLAFGKWTAQAAKPLHYAEWGGPVLRIIWAFFGLMPPVLFITGIMMWRAPIEARKKAVRMAAEKQLTMVG